jgi:superfamily II DNA or RNA helicase
MSNPITLHRHQLKAVDLLDQSSVAGHLRTVLQAPTGAGKTVLAAHLVQRSRRKAQRVAFCVPALTLIDQTVERFEQNGLAVADIGIIQGDHPLRRPHAPIQIATAQTLARRDIPDVDLVIVDECHIRFEVYDRWMADKPDLQFIGLTATPWSKGLGTHWQDLVKPTSLRELIDLGMLSKFRVFAPSHPDLKGIKTLAGDYHEGQLADRMSAPQLVADVVETWLEKAAGRPTLCFCVNRAHAALVADQFAANGVRSAYVDAYTPREERTEIGKRLAAGEIQVVCNVGVLTTGIDWDVRCISLARPTKSEILFVQIVGRGLRTADGKDDCLILDHSDTHLRLGMVTDIDYPDLDDGKAGKGTSEARKREDDIPLPKECKACSALIPASLRTCPECGNELRAPCLVETAKGELVEWGSPGTKERKGVDRLRDMDQRRVYAMLRCIQMERGRKDGWTAYTYKDLFGVWPSRNWTLIEPVEPCSEVRAFVRSKDIRFAKGAGARHAATV